MHVTKIDYSLVLFVMIVSIFAFSYPNHAEASGNPYTQKCPGNKVRYGVPKGKTATTKARKKVFGNPYPNANVQSINFMGKSVTVNKKIVPCLKAVEWDLKYKYKTNYRPSIIYGMSEVNSQNPTHYFHAYGGAIDIDPAKNPYHANCKKRKNCNDYHLPPTWVKAFKEHGFFWGGYYKDSKDYMHFEWHGQK